MRHCLFKRFDKVGKLKTVNDEKLFKSCRYGDEIMLISCKVEHF